MVPTHSGDYPKKWVLSTGIGGTFQTESGGTFKRNQWVLSTGMGWDFAPEYAPNVLVKYIEDSILEYIDMDQYRDILEQEKEEKQKWLARF